MMWTMLWLAGCGTEAPPAPEPEPVVKPEASPVETAAAIAKAIDAAPDDADAILAKHGMTEQAYRALLYEIAEDPKKSMLFLARRK